MFIFFFVLYILFFLVVGALVFVSCGAIPRLRRFALSAALWCAMWGPCAIAWVLFTGMVSFAANYSLERWPTVRSLHLPQWQSGFGIGLFWVAVLSSAAVATVTAWLHQVLVRRLTFALFRIYATGVSAGVGSVLGWVLGLTIAVYQVRFGMALWVLGMVGLMGIFGHEGFRLARQLRGTAPERFAWVTREEFEGTV